MYGLELYSKVFLHKAVFYTCWKNKYWICITYIIRSSISSDYGRKVITCTFIGLVGALSIVRFRTPIKEPEELVYLFLAIAIGLGLGAGQVLITTIIVLLILVFINFFLSNKRLSKVLEYNLIINWKNESTSLRDILTEIESNLITFKLVRYDYSNDSKSASIIIEPNNDFNIDDFIDRLKSESPYLNITFFEAKTNW